MLEERKRILFKVSTAYCRDRYEREDLAQEIVVQLWKSFPAFDQQLRFSTWMYRIALNVAISFYRRERTRTRHVLADDEMVLNAVDHRADQPEELRLLYQFIEELNPLNKALMLLYLDGDSHQEIAESLGITPTNVATKIGRLKQAMRQKFIGVAEA